MESDTIVALSTPPGEGGIGIIRLSGSDSLDIALKCFIPGKNKRKNIMSLSPRRLTYGHIIDENGTIIDEVLVCYMPAPYTYTKEDIVEINAHGGALLIKTIIKLLLNNGARLAEPGEFTKRAFLNGRIDLIQAESIISVIQARSDKALKAAQKSLHGQFSGEIKNILLELQEILAEMEAGLEFYQDDLENEVTTEEMLLQKVNKLIWTVNQIQNKSKRGRILQDGLKTVIAGRPNVGKSSLYNYLLGEERAIVTEIPGTTRDLLIEYVKIKGIPLKIIDTAGIHKKGEKDPIEKIGITYSKKAVKEADLIIFILDASSGITEGDIWIYNNLIAENSNAVLFIANKIDIAQKINRKELQDKFNWDSFVEISVKTGEGLDKLEDEVERLAFSGEAIEEESVIVLQIRQQELILKAKNYLQSALKAMENGIPPDIVSIDLRLAQDAFSELLGENIDEDLLDNIFARFCIGK